MDLLKHKTEAPQPPLEDEMAIVSGFVSSEEFWCRVSRQPGARVWREVWKRDGCDRLLISCKFVAFFSKCARGTSHMSIAGASLEIQKPSHPQPESESAMLHGCQVTATRLERTVQRPRVQPPDSIPRHHSQNHHVLMMERRQR